MSRSYRYVSAQHKGSGHATHAMASTSGISALASANNLYRTTFSASEPPDPLSKETTKLTSSKAVELSL